MMSSMIMMVSADTEEPKNIAVSFSEKYAPFDAAIRLTFMIYGKKNLSSENVVFRPFL